MAEHASAVSGPSGLSIAALIVAAMPGLTPIHRRMGAYVQANLFRAATMRIDELADAVGASVASANRFARALGFDGYPAFRSALVRGFEATLAPVERLRSAQESPASGDALLGASLEQAEVNLRLTRSDIDGAAADAAVEAILAARRVFVLGAGSSAFLAGLMEHGLMPYQQCAIACVRWRPNACSAPSLQCRRWRSRDRHCISALCRRHDPARAPCREPGCPRARPDRQRQLTARAVRGPDAVRPIRTAARGKFRRGGAGRDRGTL